DKSIEIGGHCSSPFQLQPASGRRSAELLDQTGGRIDRIDYDEGCARFQYPKHGPYECGATMTPDCYHVPPAQASIYETVGDLITSCVQFLVGPGFEIIAYCYRVRSPFGTVRKQLMGRPGPGSMNRL